jgi:hypothetical protein
MLSNVTGSFLASSHYHEEVLLLSSYKLNVYPREFSHGMGEHDAATGQASQLEIQALILKEFARRELRGLLKTA